MNMKEALDRQDSGKLAAIRYVSPDPAYVCVTCATKDNEMFGVKGPDGLMVTYMYDRDFCRGLIAMLNRAFDDGRRHEQRKIEATVVPRPPDPPPTNPFN